VIASDSLRGFRYVCVFATSPQLTAQYLLLLSWFFSLLFVSPLSPYSVRFAHGLSDSPVAFLLIPVPFSLGTISFPFFSSLLPFVLSPSSVVPLRKQFSF